MNPYEILGIPRTATREQIKAAWRVKAHERHPDRCKDIDAEERFNATRVAYELLSDPALRAKHDRSELTTGDLEALWLRVVGQPPTKREKIGLTLLDAVLRIASLCKP